MKMLKFQAVLFSQVGGQRREYKSTALDIPLVEKMRFVEKKVENVGCQKMIYPECFDKEIKGKERCFCFCKRQK